MKCKNFDSNKLRAAIHDNARYLLDIMHQNGRFTYTANLNPDITVRNDYNITRHAGTLYSLLMYASWSKDESIYSKVYKSLDYVFEEYFCPICPKNEISAILQEPIHIDHKKKHIVKLGANGLTLVATAILATRYPAMKFRKKITDLYQFIHFMQLQSGQFHAKYDINQQDYVNWESLYYPGEACLGLAFAYNLEQKNEYLTTAINGLRYLAKIRANAQKIPADHWALIATSVLFKILTQKGGHQSDIEVLYHHALQIVSSLIKEHANSSLDDIERKGWNLSYATCQTATRMEGLIAIYPWIRDKNLQLYLKDTIQVSINFLLNAQVKSGQFHGAIPKLHCHPLGHNQMMAMAPDATELRIDYNQHVLSAWISYERLMLTSSPT